MGQTRGVYSVKVKFSVSVSLIFLWKFPILNGVLKAWLLHLQLSVSSAVDNCKQRVSRVNVVV